MPEQQPTNVDKIVDPDTGYTLKDLLPKGSNPNLRGGLEFTEYAQDLILDLVRAGESVPLACEMAGVPTTTVYVWLRRGRTSTDRKSAYRKFFKRYADARLRGLQATHEKAQRRQRDPQGYGDEPVINSYNDLPHSFFSEQNKISVLQNIRSGMFPGVAAEAAGVPAQVLTFWVSEGRNAMSQGDISNEFYSFYINYIKTAAQARGNAEARVYEDTPSFWLLNGPARDTAEQPGWTKTNTVVGAGGGPIQIETHWTVKTEQAIAEHATSVEGSVTSVKQITENNGIIDS